MENADPRTEILHSLIAGLGFRALATAHSLASSVRLAPSVTVKRALLAYVDEELGRFESAAMLYQELEPGANLYQAVRPRLEELPAPESWLEVVVVQTLFDRAGEMQLAEGAESADPRLSKLAKNIVKGSRAHAVMVSESGSALRNMLHGDPEQRTRAQGLVDRWLGVSLRVFGRSGSSRGKEAIELGLKRRDSADVMAEYMSKVRPILETCGLKVPSAKAMGVDLPAGILEG